MPIVRRDIILNIARNLKALLGREAATKRDALPASWREAPTQNHELRQARTRLRRQDRQIRRMQRRLSRVKSRRSGGKQIERIRELRKQLAKENREVANLKARLAALSDGTDGRVRPEDIVWIFGTGRSGTTWLASMMGEIKGTGVWDEPWVGALFGDFYLDRLGQEEGKAFILSEHHRQVWLSGIRAMILGGAASRHPQDLETLVIKEPHGSTGAPLLMEALPESRLVLLVRDPRDVAASALEAHRSIGWTPRYKERKGLETVADKKPNRFVERRAKLYLREVGGAREAYDAHKGYKALLKYEELRADTLATMKRLYSALGIEVDEEELAHSVEKHSWQNIPEEDKGEGKFYRKASPGSWRGDLTPRQVEIVERITAPILEEFYPVR